MSITFPWTKILVNFLKQTSAIPSLPNANVPRYPTTIAPAVPGNPDISVAHGRGDVGVVNPPIEAFDVVLVKGKCGCKTRVYKYFFVIKIWIVVIIRYE